MSESERMFIKSLGKGMRLLEAFTIQRPRLTLTELAEETGMNRATVQRLTYTLLSLEYLDRDEYKRYHLAPKVLALGQAFSGGSDLCRLAGPSLERLSRRLGCSVNLSVLDGEEVVILFRREVGRFLKYDLRAGSRLPAYCTSMGKLLLAALPDRELRPLVRGLRLERLTAHTITSRKALWEVLMGVRQRGMAASDREASLDLCSRAMPLLERDGSVAASVSVSFSAEESGANRKNMEQGLLDVGRRLSSLMGYQGPYPVVGPPLGGPRANKD